MKEGDSRRNATRAGTLAAFVLAASAAGGALFADSVRQPAQGAGPFPSETALMPTEQSSPTPRLEWTHQEQKGERRELANSSDIPRLENVINTIIQESAMPSDLHARLDSLKTAPADKINLNLDWGGFIESSKILYNGDTPIEEHTLYNYRLLSLEREDPEIYYSGDELVWAQDTVDSHGKHRLFASFWVNEQDKMVTRAQSTAIGNPARLILIAQRVIKVPLRKLEIRPENTNDTTPDTEDVSIFAESEDENSFYWVRMYPATGKLEVSVQDKEFHNPPLAYGPNHPAPTSSPSV